MIFNWLNRECIYIDKIYVDNYLMLNLLVFIIREEVSRNTGDAYQMISALRRFGVGIPDSGAALRPGNFSRIFHDYKEERKGFIIWKDTLEERLT